MSPIFVPTFCLGDQSVVNFPVTSPLASLPVITNFSIVAGNAFDKYVVVSPFNNAFLFFNKNSS